MLASCYKQGLGVKVDLEKSFNFLKKASEYTQMDRKEHFEVKFALGEMFFNGEGVERSYEEALKCYNDILDSGWDKVEYRIGACFENGGQGLSDFKLELGCNGNNLELAAKHYRNAARNNFKLARIALYNLIKKHIELADTKNPICLIDYLSSSDLFKKPEYQYKIALCYEDGTDGEQNIQEAYNWYKKAAEQDFPLAKDACKRLAEEYPDVKP